MISVQNRQWFVLIHSNQEYGSQIIIRTEEASANRRDLGLERARVDSLALAHALRNFDDRESSWSKIPPLSPRKYPNSFQVRISNFNLIPLGFGRKLFP